jgi:hypothetical protein
MRTSEGHRGGIISERALKIRQHRHGRDSDCPIGITMGQILNTVMNRHNNDESSILRALRLVSEGGMERKEPRSQKHGTMAGSFHIGHCTPMRILPWIRRSGNEHLENKGKKQRLLRLLFRTWTGLFCFKPTDRKTYECGALTMPRSELESIHKR